MNIAENIAKSVFLTGLYAEQVRRELSLVFGTEFSFLDADQRRIFDRQVTEARTTADLASVSLPLRHWEARIINLGDQRKVLAVPITQNGTIAAIAVAVCPDVSPRQCIRTAQLVIEKIQAQHEIDHLRQQNEEHLLQATQNLEELTFLRSFAKHLEATDTSGTRWKFAEKILPPLLHSICAEQLFLIDAIRDEGADVPNSVVLQFGQHVLTPAGGMDLVRKLSVESRRVTHVCNQLSVESISDPFGVRNLIVAPLTRAGHAQAWLVAINRTTSGQQLKDVRWALSQHEFGTSEASLVESAASILMTHEANVELLRDQEQLVANVVRALVTSIEAKDHYTRGHSERVALFAQCLATEMRLSSEHCERLYLTGLVHDVGKIGVSDAILTKPSALTDEEFEEIKRHPDEGWAILRDLEQLAYVLPGVLYHHERYDGRGYPDGLAGEEIPLDGRILAVADAYDAMTSDRAYRTGRSQEEAEAVLRDGAGTQWDPKVVDAFFRVSDQIAQLRRSYRPSPRQQRKQSSVSASNDDTGFNTEELVTSTPNEDSRDITAEAVVAHAGASE